MSKQRCLGSDQNVRLKQTRSRDENLSFEVIAEVMRKRLFSGEKELLILMGTLALKSTPKEEERGKES